MNHIDILRAALDYVYGDAKHNDRIVKTLEIYFMCIVLCMLGAVGGALYLMFLTYSTAIVAIGIVYHILVLQGLIGSSIIYYISKWPAGATIASLYIQSLLIFAAEYINVPELLYTPILSKLYSYWSRADVLFRRQDAADAYAYNLLKSSIYSMVRRIISYYLFIILLDAAVYCAAAAFMYNMFIYVAGFVLILVREYVDTRRVVTHIIDTYVDISYIFIQHQQMAEEQSLQKNKYNDVIDRAADWNISIGGYNITRIVTYMQKYDNTFSLSELKKKLIDLKYYDIVNTTDNELVIQYGSNTATINFDNYIMTYGPPYDRKTIEILYYENFIEYLINYL